MPREISCDNFGTDFGPKFFAAVKVCVRNRVRSRRDTCRLVVRSFLTTLRGPKDLFRAKACCAACDFVRFGADFGPKFSKISAVAKLCVRNRVRSRQNPCRLVVRSFLTSLRGPEHLLRASACCAACDSDRISDRNNFRGRTIIFRSKIYYRARSRRTSCRLVVRSFLTTLRGAQHLLRASACCAA